MHFFRSLNSRLLTILTAGMLTDASMADTYRFNDAVGNDWMAGENWQNQSTGTNGWQVGGIPLPGATDTVRFNYSDAAGTLSADAGTIDALQIGVDEGGALTLRPGASLNVSSGNWSGIGAGGSSSGSLTVEGGILTVQNGWKMGVNTNAHHATLEISGGEMRVSGSGFSQDQANTTAVTRLSAGLLHVTSMSLSNGVVDIAGGTLEIEGDSRLEVASWENNGSMTAYAGIEGASLEVTYGSGTTSVVAKLGSPPAEEITHSAEPTVSGPGSEGYHTNGTALGQPVWIAENMLYFNLPTGKFPVGSPVYLKIDYLDLGRGRLQVKYDSDHGEETADKFRPSEIHTRSSRVDQGGFASSYHLFDNPRFANRQNGGNDFRIELANNNDEAFQVAGVSVSSVPFPDERFAYSLSRPWLKVNNGPSNDFVDPDTLVGKVMTGYQGWFATPNDLDDQGWRHWGRSASVDPSPTQITIDMWPWLDDYQAEHVYPAGSMELQDGRPAYLFSSRDPETVQRHFSWMRKHDIDGAYLQRFVSRSSSGYYGAPEFVLDNVRKAANREGRVWAIEYDVSSLTKEADPFEVIRNDWNWLVDEVGILDDPRYVHENGKPVLFIWGFSVPGREGLTLEEADEILDWFGTQDLYLIAGVHSSWESNTGWFQHYQKYDQLLAWMERSLSDLNSQKARLDSWNMKILPHAWPGFSWHNLKQLEPDQQYTPRNQGDFYWERLYNAVSCGADQIFLGMFDEYDEATAIMPMADNHPAPHSEWGKYIDNEGRDPFWYLQLGDAAREMLNGTRPLTSIKPGTASVPAGSCVGIDASIHLGTTDTTNGLNHVQPADGLTQGTFVDGHHCRTIQSGSYLYFDIDDTICHAKTDGQTATVEIEFHDSHAGTALQLQYDGLGAPYTAHPGTLDPPELGGWRKIRWNINDGYFGNRQNNASDFRIAQIGGNSIPIRRVSVFLPEDEGNQEPDSQAQLRFINDELDWDARLDATGWRLMTSPTLNPSDWTEASPLIHSEGKTRFQLRYTQGQEFFRLQRPARR